MDKERWAIRETFRALYRVGIKINSRRDAEAAIDLAARMLSYELDREVTVEELKEQMRAMIVDDLADGSIPTIH